MGEQEVQQRRKLEEILQELLSASFQEKAQARCSPSASVSDHLSSGSLLSSSILLISSPHQDQVPPPPSVETCAWKEAAGIYRHQRYSYV